MINEQRFEWDLEGHEIRINCIIMKWKNSQDKGSAADIYYGLTS